MGYGRWQKGGDDFNAADIHGRISRDDGKNWQKSNNVDVRELDPKNVYGADEPAVIELNDGRVMMIVRTDQGDIAKVYSADGGASRKAILRSITACGAEIAVCSGPVKGTRASVLFLRLGR